MELAEVSPRITGKAVVLPVRAPGGRLLLAAGEVLTPRQIAHLRERGVTHLYVRDPFMPDLPPDGADLDADTRLAAEEALSAALSGLAEGRGHDLRHLTAVVRDLKAQIDRSVGVRFCLSRLRAADRGTLAHSVNVAVLALIIAQALGLSEEAQVTCALGGLLHDIGKAMVPTTILLKPGPLDSAEWRVMRQHPALGHAVLMLAGGVDPSATQPALDHHERLDGSGYPSGLTGSNIGLATRIVTVADIWDALISARVYKPSWTPAQAAAHLRSESRTKLDSRVVTALLTRVAVFPNGTYVRMADGVIGWVVRQSAADATRPTVLALTDRSGQSVKPFLVPGGGAGAKAIEGIEALPAAVAAYLGTHRDDALRAVAEMGSPASEEPPCCTSTATAPVA